MYDGCSDVDHVGDYSQRCVEMIRSDVNVMAALAMLKGLVVAVDGSGNSSNSQLSKQVWHVALAPHTDYPPRHANPILIVPKPFCMGGSNSAAAAAADDDDNDAVDVCLVIQHHLVFSVIIVNLINQEVEWI